ncbi:MAG: hypothetical protein Q9160_005289 [Pyrenula sp. 1 TL-2023]
MSFVMEIKETIPNNLLGSDSWTGASAWDSDDELHERATTALGAINWNAILTKSSSLRDGLPCAFAEKFSVGHFNMVRRITFEDGISWVARIRLPLLKGEAVNGDFLGNPRYLKSEIATMRLLRSRSSIPVPAIYAYDAHDNNDVGAPYILMEYLDGNIATELVAAKGLKPFVFGTPDQDRAFRRRLAEIQVILSSITFDQIGSLYEDEDTHEFFIGPEVETGKGPWRSPADYYNDVTEHALEMCAKWADSAVHMATSFANPILFNHLMSLCRRDETKPATFSLTNRDFGAHNVLVNENFEILGVIDLDNVIAAPIEVVAQFPEQTGMTLGPPGHVETRPLAIQRIKEEEPTIRAYQSFVDEAELCSDKLSEARFAALMLSDAASLCRGLKSYDSFQKWANDNWQEAYLKILHKHLKPLPSPPESSP